MVYDNKYPNNISSHYILSEITIYTTTRSYKKFKQTGSQNLEALDRFIHV